ncbi:MAG: hypothetical protein GY861_24630 [bacterium]|nr:hypothetical protein [bacterium]
MAKTTCSAIGGVLHDSRADELIITGIADGTVQAGDLCTVLTTGAVRQSDKSDSYDETLGIALPMYHTDMDTAYASGKTVDIVVPQGGHIYGVKGADAGSVEMGEIVVFGEAGALALGDGAQEGAHMAKIFKEVDDDTYWLIVWGA